MRFTNTFLLIALLSFSYTNSFEFASLVEVNEISASAYGKSLLETITLSMEQKGNINEVQTLLNDLLFKLNQDQAKSDAWWKKENARLLAKIKQLTKEIAALRKQILRALAEKARNEKLRDQAAKNLVQYKKQRAHNDKVLAENQKRRNEDKAEFRRSQSDHTDVLNALDAVMKDLVHLVGSVSGGGKPESVKANAEEQRDSLKRSFAQITQDEAELNAFIELATSVDQKALWQLINGVKKIKASVQQSYNDDVRHEKRSIKAYKALKRLLKNDNAQLDNMITRQTKRHKEYVNRIAKLVVKIAQLRKLRKAKKATKAATIEERLLKERRYLADKAQRDEERRVIQKVQKIVATRLANMSKYLKERVD